MHVPTVVEPARTRTQGGRLGIPYYVYAVAFSSFFVIVGVIWDISWHISIGRDGLFSAPHLAIYLGAVVAGCFSGYQVLKTTFVGTATEKAHSVRFWGIFYSSLGALFCIWGAFAMLTSAPFDDWWHNTYGGPTDRSAWPVWSTAAKYLSPTPSRSRATTASGCRLSERIVFLRVLLMRL